MGDQYVGEIRLFAGNYAPQGWAMCNGQLLPIADYQVLFALIGTTYGGDGQTTFALPNLQGRASVHMGSNAGTTYPLAQMAGSETVTLLPNQLPVHTHMAQAATASGDNASPTNNTWAVTGTGSFVNNPTETVPMSPQAIVAQGGSQPHENMMPFLALNYIIAVEGMYPSFN